MRINREEFLRQLEAVRPGLARKDVLGQSSCFVFQDGNLFTFNDEVACRAKTSLDVVGAVSAIPLLELVSKLPEEDIDVDVEEGVLVVKGKRRKAKLPMEVEILLPVDAVESPSDWSPLPDEFMEALSIVSQGASKDEGNFVLTCLHLSPEYMEACDNFRVIRYPMELGMQDMLVRATAMRQLVGLDFSHYSESPSWLHFKNSEGLVVSCRRYLDDYPNLDNVLKVADSTKTVLPKGLEDAVAIAQVFSLDNVEGSDVLVELKSNRLRLTGKGNSGTYSEIKKVEYSGTPLSFTVAPKLLVEICKRTNECEIMPGRLAINGGTFKFVACLGVSDG